MNVFTKFDQKGVKAFAALVFMIAMAGSSAMAANKSVLRSDADGTFTGRCCAKWDESVTVFEPTTLVPVVVTWSTDYQSNAPFIVGLSLNGGPCTLFGSASMMPHTPTNVHLAPSMHQWVILPGDYGLRSGKNVITLCGGGAVSDTDSITIWGNTLVAHLAR